MPSAVLTKDLAERRLPVISLAVVLALFTVAALAISAGLQDTITDLTRGFPDALNAFIGADVPGGYVVGEVFNLIAPFALVTYAVVTGAAAIAGEEATGTLDLLAAQPVTRRAVLADKASGLAIALAVCVALFGMSAAAAAAVFGIGVAATSVVATSVHLFLLAAAFGSVALAIGAATGKPSLAAGATGIVAAVSYVTNAMLPLAGLHSWARLSPWYYYAGADPLRNGLSAQHVAVLAVLAAGALVAAGVAFERRDLTG